MLNQVSGVTQQSFVFRQHGGARDGAGRKRTLPGKPRVPHLPRATLKPRFPVHVTKRIRRGVTRLRRFELCKVLQRAFVLGCRKNGFRICQFSIQGNHIHMICEAETTAALSRGIQGWSVRIARGVNGHLGRAGSVFEDRYHVEILTTPMQTRNALCYVLQNARRHGEPIDPSFGGIDPFSSAWWFDGWDDDSWRDGIRPPPMRSVAEPESWLLREGWRRHGLIALGEIPAAAQDN